MILRLHHAARTSKSNIPRLGLNVKISNPAELMCGENVHINDDCILSCLGGLTIGSNTHIARRVIIYTQNHNYKGDLLPYNNESIKRPVTIGKNCWIGVGVTICPGTQIGEGAIIGAGTVLYGKIPKLSIVGSSEPKIISHRDETHYNSLDQQRSYGGVNGNPLK